MNKNSHYSSPISDEKVNLKKIGGKLIYPTPYNTPIVVFNDQEKFEKAVSIFCLPPDEEEAQANYSGMVVPITSVDGTRFILSALPKSIDDHYDEETLWHEMLHCSWFVLDFAGVKIDTKNHEAQTYLQGALVRSVKKALYKIKY